MTGLEKFIGEALDGKYRLERLLGQGGMGAVYLATHLGTERPVALKLIAPQFMRHDEFVERFKREARAAGRLRHPNVVDVTDFGFAQADGERVAYLVMEYLDGCTLGDVLAEEKRLPLEWTVDILEQVCSAVEEAHQQGIVHRDLKPDNIWLEPNRLGGYRVKVLDFGIAKLAEAGAQPTGDATTNATTDATNDATSSAASSSSQSSPQSPLDVVQASIARAASSLRQPDATPDDAGAEGSTLLFAPAPQIPPRADEAGEQQTRIFASPSNNDDDVHAPASDAQQAHATAAAPAPHHTQLANDADRTRLFDAPHARPTARREAHDAPTEDEREPMLTAAAGAALTRVGSIMGTPIYMSPEQCRGERLDARSDIYSLGVITYQMLAGETPFTGDMATVMRAHMNDEPQPLRERNKKVSKPVERVVMLSLSKNPPVRPQSAAAFARSLRAQSEGVGALYRKAFALYSEHFPKFVRLSLIAHLPVIALTLLMIALQLAEKSLPKIVLLVSVFVVALLEIAAYFLAASVISGVTALIVTQLQVAPMRPVQLRTAFNVLRRRWRPFLRTGIRVSLKVILGYCLLFIPGLIVATRYLLYAPVVLMEDLEGKAALRRARALAARSWRTLIIVALLQILIPAIIGALLGRFSVKAQHVNAGVGVHVSQNLSGLVNIFIVPLLSIVPALLYLKMRQMGGESVTDTLAQIEEVEAAHTNWQRRMRERLSGYTPQTRSRVATPQQTPSDPSKLA